MNTFLFECKKVYRNKKNIFLLILFLLFITFTYFTLLNVNASLPKNQLSDIDINDLEQTKDELENEDTPQDSALLESTNKEIKYAKKELAFKVSKDWYNSLKFKIKRESLSITNMHNGLSVMDPNEVQTLSNALNIDKYLFRNHIKPETSGFEISGFGFSFRILKNISPYIIVFLITIFLGDMISAEKRRNTNELMSLMPKSLLYQLTIKAIVNGIFLISVFLSGIIYSFLLGCSFGGKGSFKYPITVYKSDSTDILPFWKYLMLYFLMLVGLIILYNCIILLVSLFVKNDLSVICLIIIISLAPSFVSVYFPFLRKIFGYYPFNYANISESIQGTDGYSISLNLTYITGICIILITSLLLYLMVSIVLFNRKKL